MRRSPRYSAIDDFQLGAAERDNLVERRRIRDRADDVGGDGDPDVT